MPCAIAQMRRLVKCALHIYNLFIASFLLWNHSFGGVVSWVEYKTKARFPFKRMSHAPHATQALALRAMRALCKGKTQSTQALDWLFQWLAASIDHSYWLALAFVEWKILCNVICLRNFLAFIAFLAHFLFCLRIFSYARPCVRCVRLNGNRA